jgi:hypothetical protein
MVHTYIRHVDLPALPMPPQSFCGMTLEPLEEWPRMWLQRVIQVSWNVGKKKHEIQHAGQLTLWLHHDWHGRRDGFENCILPMELWGWGHSRCACMRAGLFLSARAIANPVVAGHGMCETILENISILRFGWGCFRLGTLRWLEGHGCRRLIRCCCVLYFAFLVQSSSATKLS